MSAARSRAVIGASRWLAREHGQRGRHHRRGQGGLQQGACHGQGLLRLAPTAAICGWMSGGRRCRAPVRAGALPVTGLARSLTSDYKQCTYMATLPRKSAHAAPGTCTVARLMPRLAVALLAAVLTAVVPHTAAAQPSKERPFIQATRVDAAPRIDGAARRRRLAVGHARSEGFTQQEPNLGQPATERTEVRILYDSRNIYIGVHAYQAGGVSAAAEADGAGADAGAHAHHSDGRRGHRDAARLRPAVRRGQLPGHPRHLQRLAQRLHVRDDAARREARAADLRRRRGRRPRHHVERQPQLGRRVGRRPRRSPTTAGRPRSRSRPTRCASSRATSRPGASTSCATSAARTSSRTGRRFPKAYSLTRVSLAGELRGLQVAQPGHGPEAEAVRGRPACATAS